MVPGLTLRESQFAETRRQELLDRVAAEQRVRLVSSPDQRKPRLAGIIERTTALIGSLRRIRGLTTKAPATTARALTTPK